MFCLIQQVSGGADVNSLAVAAAILRCVQPCLTVQRNVVQCSEVLESMGGWVATHQNVYFSFH